MLGLQQASSVFSLGIGTSSHHLPDRVFAQAIMSNNASSYGGNSDLTVHHSKVTDYIVNYKQFTVG